MTSRYVPFVLVLVGVVSLAGGGWLWTDIRECRNTQSVMVVEGYTGPEYDMERFESLSDRQQTVFRRALDSMGSDVEANRDVRLPGAVEYETKTYEVRTFHVDDCGLPFGYLAVMGSLVVGVGALVFGVLSHRRDPFRSA